MRERAEAEVIHDTIDKTDDPLIQKSIGGGMMKQKLLQSDKFKGRVVNSARHCLITSRRSVDLFRPTLDGAKCVVPKVEKAIN